MALLEGTVISPGLKNPKKQSTDAAHNIIVSGLPAFGCHIALIAYSTAGVVGSLALGSGSSKCDLHVANPSQVGLYGLR